MTTTSLHCPLHFGFGRWQPLLRAEKFSPGRHVLECEAHCGYWTTIADTKLAELTGKQAAA